MLALYDVVQLKEPDIQHGVAKDNVGTIVDVLKNGEAYTVEFIDSNGETISSSLDTQYRESQLTRIWQASK